MVGRDARRPRGHGPAGAGFAAGLDPASLCRHRTADSDDPVILVTFTGEGSNQDPAVLLRSAIAGVHDAFRKAITRLHVCEGHPRSEQ